MRKPNILIVMCDQMSAGALGAYGNPFAITPHLDELAARSTIFENAYCNYPICAPSRASMMAGRQPSRIGVYDNAAEFPASIPTFAHYLCNLGYQTSLIGKMHFVGPDQLHGFEERLTAELYPTDFAWNKVGVNFPKEQVANSKGITNSGAVRNSVQIEHDELVAFRASRKLFDLAKRGDERPFLLVASFTHPHEPYFAPQTFWDLYSDVEIPAPKVPPLALEQHDPLSRRSGEVLDFFHDFTPEQIQTARRAYYGSVSYVDALVGRVLAALRDSGQADDTIVMFLSDHGDMLGERGLWYKKVFFEAAMRVPLMIAGPGIDATRRVQTPVSLVDLAPTLVALAGGDPVADTADPFDGVDLFDAAGHRDDRPVFAEIMSEGIAHPVVMIRRGKHKFIGGPMHPVQLFDLAEDPDELRNLALEPESAALVAEFGALMEQQWDFASLEEDILVSQKRRAIIQRAHRQGHNPGWDHEAASFERDRWLRDNGDYDKWAYSNLA